MYKYLLLFLLLSGFSLTVKAQQPVLDTIKDRNNRQDLKKDSITSKRFVPKVTKKEKVYHPDSLHSPHKAVMRALMIPGWGAIYNHQWWQLPIIYGGLGLLADAIIFNQHYYKPALVVAHYYEEGRTSANLPPSSKDYDLWLLYQQNNASPQTVDDIVDSYRRNRDLSIMGFVAGWGIQAAWAYVNAKFQHSYTMDTNFSMRIEPAIINQDNSQWTLASVYGGEPVIPGLKLTFTF